jgi:lipopolysaccharide heptosyltransferase II
VKILILKPSSLGDVIQALPVLRLLKKHLPKSEIYWWIDASLAPILEGDPDLSGIIRFERRRWAAPIHWGELWRSVLWTRQMAFDWVIDLQCLARSATFGWLANGQMLVGLDEPREAARGLYDLIARRPSFHTHAVDWYLGVLPLLAVPVSSEFDWLPKRPQLAEELRKKWSVANDRWVLLQPGARWGNKRWPVDFFAEVLRRLATAYSDLRFAVLGAAEDKPLGKAISMAAPKRCLDLTGELSLPEMIEWIRLSQLMVSNDTGPMHVAAALGKPVISLFGPTEPRRTGPYGQLEHALQVKLPCAPCLKSKCRHTPYLECLLSLSPDRVLEAMERHLAL